MTYLFHSKNSYSLISLSTPSEKSLCTGKLTRAQQVKQVNLKAQILSLATNIINCFPWSDKLTVFIFKKMTAKYLGLNNQFAWQSFFQVKMMFHTKYG